MNKKPTLTSEAEVQGFLDKLYDFCLKGIPKVSRPISEMAADYRSE